jgi:hypothetical protein
MFLNRNFIDRSELTLTVEDQHPYTTTAARHAGYSQINRARIFKRSWSPGIDSKE